MIGGRLARLGSLGTRLDRALALMAVAVGLLVLAVSGMPAVNSLRERLFDAIAAIGGAEARQSWPVLVDIDRAALEIVGPWPWSRDRLASLLDAVSAAGPKAVGIDILLDGADTRSPAALARSLARISSEAGLPDRELGKLAERLPDGDRMLSEAIARVPMVLGAALDGEAGSRASETRPIVVQDRFDARGLWPASGLVMPPPRLAEAAAGVGTLALVGDMDGAVRRVPLVAALPGALVAGLALELARVANGQAFLIIDGQARRVRVGPQAIAFGHDGMLRLITGLAAMGGPARISAASLLSHDAAALAALKDRVVIVGGSAPQLGGLRAQADGSLLPSLDLQAMAFAQIASGVVPRRPRAVVLLETLAIIAAALLAVIAARRLAPGPGLAAVGTGALIWLAGSLACGRLLLVLVDPISVPTAAAASFALAALLVASDARRRAGLIRQRFEQHLAPTVVQRIADNPEALRVAGEMREITALFTDVEGFTAMTDRAEPARLIAALDDYFDGVCRIVVAHGGLVDKIIGDAVHALFNAPFDLPEHPRRALDCALEVQHCAAQDKGSGLRAHAHRRGDRPGHRRRRGRRAQARLHGLRQRRERGCAPRAGQQGDRYGDSGRSGCRAPDWRRCSDGAGQHRDPRQGRTASRLHTLAGGLRRAIAHAFARGHGGCSRLGGSGAAANRATGGRAAGGCDPGASRGAARCGC